MSTIMDRRQYLRLVVASFASLVSLFAVPLYAWNRGGHLVSGALAHDEVKRVAPASLTKALALLEQHPAREKWQREIDDAPGVDRSKALFMLAAAFPDDARVGEFKRYDRPDWHYVNFRYTPGQPLTDVLTAEPFNGHLLDALASNLKLYRDKSVPPVERAVALSWVLHLAGDITQPLHVTALVNDDFPKGDRGGNSVHVRGSERAKRSVKLHKMWDDGATGPGVKLREAGNRATVIAGNVSKDKIKLLPSQAVRNEIANSYNSAVGDVYLQGLLRYVVDEDASAPVVPEGYTKQLKVLSEQQMMRSSQLFAVLLANSD